MVFLLFRSSHANVSCYINAKQEGQNSAGEPLEFYFKTTGPEERLGPARYGTLLCLFNGATRRLSSVLQQQLCRLCTGNTFEI